MLKLIRAYKKLGVLGLNARNLLYIARYNSRKNYPFADNKLKFKEVAQAAGLAVPELYGVISSVAERKILGKILNEHPESVIKPAHGSGGEGVLVLSATGEQGRFARVSGQVIDLDSVQHHISNTLHGMYSLGGQADQAMIEYRVKIDPIFENVSYRGVPDIRIIVFTGVPVMAMIRLPTKISKGRANLHQGAIGAGIILSEGVTRAGVQGSSVVDTHPDTGISIKGIKIPHWDNLLENASRCYELTGLGYLGVDIVIDQDKGPMILEINARPGLAVQIANHVGLNNRLMAVEAEGRDLSDTSARIALGKAVSTKF